MIVKDFTRIAKQNYLTIQTENAKAYIDKIIFKIYDYFEEYEKILKNERSITRSNVTVDNIYYLSIFGKLQAIKSIAASISNKNEFDIYNGENEIIEYKIWSRECDISNSKRIKKYFIRERYNNQVYAQLIYYPKKQDNMLVFGRNKKELKKNLLLRADELFSSIPIPKNEHWENLFYDLAMQEKHGGFQTYSFGFPEMQIMNLEFFALKSEDQIKEIILENIDKLPIDEKAA